MSIKKQIIVGLSGGVDSSVSLMLLKKQGYQPVGVSLKYAVWQNKKNRLKENVCCSARSFGIAKNVCQKLKVPYYILDCRREFQKIVIDYFLKRAKKIMTPSPCAVCNRYLKFKKLVEFADRHKIKYVATGHYARIKKERAGLRQLLKAKDQNKDQTYFLSLLTQKQLSRTVFPLGNLFKKEVYQIAKQEGFSFFEKQKQSQDLCFVAQKSIPDFLEAELGLKPGVIVDTRGSVLGKHKGLYFYTLGQRRGLNLARGPWWVSGYDKKNNRLIVSNNKNEPLFFSRLATISDFNLISGKIPKKPIKVKAKIRISHQPTEAVLYPPKYGRIKVVFEKPQKAITSGQWLVFYQGEVCLGGGMISS